MYSHCTDRSIHHSVAFFSVYASHGAGSVLKRSRFSLREDLIQLRGHITVRPVRSHSHRQVYGAISTCLSSCASGLGSTALAAEIGGQAPATLIPPFLAREQATQRLGITLLLYYIQLMHSRVHLELSFGFPISRLALTLPTNPAILLPSGIIFCHLYSAATCSFCSRFSHSGGVIA
ncbi:hypothetical protein OH77DRAFT_354596 [Trametes cingulata]|nr:hypothetical protein OH77DRAFT_354596 [Trametes cingulata]